MKSHAMGLAFLVALAGFRLGEGARRTQSAEGMAKDRTLTTVVKKLQQMLDESKKEQEAEHETYAKFVCYCDTTLAAKAAKTSKAKDNVDKQESEIQKLQGQNGELSSECAGLQADMEDNEKRRGEADATRKEENDAFLANEADLEQALSMMRDAIETLSAVGADQTLEDAANDAAALADHDQYMAKGVDVANVKKSLVALAQTDKRTVATARMVSAEKVLLNAAAFLKPEQQQVLSAFVEQRLRRHRQPAFTGTYSAQSGEIVGILKNMKDTFTADLKQAREAEAAAAKAHDEWTTQMLAAHDDMNKLYAEKQAALGENDGALAEARQSLAEAVENRDASMEFTATLTPICERKSKEFEERKMLHQEEQAALSEAISILDSDSTFATYGKLKNQYNVAEVDASVSFFQLGRGRGGTQVATRKKIQQLLRISPRFHKIIVLLKADNPFKDVLAEIRKMIAVIDKEAVDDKQKKEFCDNENERLSTSIKNEGDTIAALEARKQAVEAEIAQLTQDIADLVQAIADAENNIAEAKDQFKSDTETYEDETSTESSMIDILTQAIVALEKYYGEKGIIQQGDAVTLEAVKDDLRDPAKTLQGEAETKTWNADKDFAGQSNAAGDRTTGVIGILQKISDEMVAAQVQEHLKMVQTQMDFEQFMNQETIAIATAKENKDDKELQMAAAHNKEGTIEELGLIPTKRDLDKSRKLKASLEADLAQITPGCDFIVQSIEERGTKRDAEKAALNNAIKLLEGSDVFKRFLTEQESKDLGKCTDVCEGKFNNQQAACQACLAQVTVDGYCAGHPGAPGCGE